jgi:hypothetical protein
MNRALLRSLHHSLRRFHGDEVVYAKAPKLSERQIWINVENPNGYFERIPGEIGKSLFEVLRDYNTGVGGFCSGGDLYNLREKPVEPNASEPYCRLCMVEIKKEWFDRLEIHPLEQDAMDAKDYLGFNKTKRLSCCITLEPWMNDIIVRIPVRLPNSETDIFHD